MLLENESDVDKNEIVELISPFLGKQNSKTLVETKPSLDLISKLSFPDIRKTLPNLPERKFSQLKAAFKLGCSFVDEKIPQYSQITIPEDVAKLMTKHFRFENKEQMYSIAMDAPGHVLDIQHLSSGSVDKVLASPREIFAHAIEHNASCVAIAHNHPCGDHRPSLADIKLAIRCKEVGEALSIQFFDHVVVGTRSDDREKNYSSVYELGFLNE